MLVLSLVLLFLGRALTFVVMPCHLEALLKNTFYYIPRRWIVFFCAIWLVPLSRNILYYSPPSKTKWHPVLFKLRKKNFFLLIVDVVPKKQRDFAIFKDMSSFYFLVINVLRMCFISKCFVFTWWVSDEPTFRKIVWKIKKNNYMKKHFCAVNAKTIISTTILLHFGK